MYAISCVLFLPAPYPAITVVIGCANAIIAAAAGTTIASVWRIDRAESRATSVTSPSDASDDICGSAAVASETVTMPCGTRMISMAVL